MIEYNGQDTDKPLEISSDLIGLIKGFLDLHLRTDDESRARLDKILGGIGDVIDGAIQKNEVLVEDGLSQVGALAREDLFDEVGRLTRRLHSSLVDFRQDLVPRLQNYATSGVPQATDHLESVMQMTDQATHTVLALTEKLSSSLREQEQHISILSESISVVDFNKTVPETALAVDLCNKTAQRLGVEILIAQEFQDLSGQILKKVISLIKEVEISLVELVRMFGLSAIEDAKVSDPKEKSEPSNQRSCSQDDINDLLGSLGF